MKKLLKQFPSSIRVVKMYHSGGYSIVTKLLEITNKLVSGTTGSQTLKKLSYRIRKLVL
jgi:hypothetical protein